jgi:N6-adenosine-specific RNA methylase IME4
MSIQHARPWPAIDVAELRYGLAFCSSVEEIALLWCTSSNIVRAIKVAAAWGFEYKTHAIWDKMRIGMGKVFRNQHEVLLYCVRGKPPKPIKLFPSVFHHERTNHSTKPPEIRQAIECMYPDFDRLELFSRGQCEGWSCVGYGFSRSR